MLHISLSRDSRSIGYMAPVLGFIWPQKVLKHLTARRASRRVGERVVIRVAGFRVQGLGFRV